MKLRNGIAIGIGLVLELSARLVLAQPPSLPTEIVCNRHIDPKTNLVDHRDCCLKQFKKDCANHQLFLNCRHGDREDGIAQCTVEYGSHTGLTLPVSIGFTQSEWDKFQNRTHSSTSSTPPVQTAQKPSSVAAVVRTPVNTTPNDKSFFSKEIACYHAMTFTLQDANYPDNEMVVEGTHNQVKGAYVLKRGSNTATFYPNAVQDSSTGPVFFPDFFQGRSPPTHGQSGVMEAGVTQSLFSTLSENMVSVNDFLKNPTDFFQGNITPANAKKLVATGSYLLQELTTTCRGLPDAPRDLNQKIEDMITEAQQMVAKYSSPTTPVTNGSAGVQKGTH